MSGFLGALGRVDPLLLAGFGLIFAGMVAGILVTTVGRRDRQAVGRSLEALTAFRAAPTVLREHELDQPFTDRVIGLAEGNVGFVSMDRAATGSTTTTPDGFYDFVASFFK